LLLIEYLYVAGLSQAGDESKIDHELITYLLQKHSLLIYTSPNFKGDRMDLIKLSDTNKDFPVDSRDLHEFLKVETSHSTWMQRKCDDLQEGLDFLTDLKESGGRLSISAGTTGTDSVSSKL